MSREISPESPTFKLFPSRATALGKTGPFLGGILDWKPWEKGLIELQFLLLCKVCEVSNSRQSFAVVIKLLALGGILCCWSCRYDFSSGAVSCKLEDVASSVSVSIQSCGFTLRLTSNFFVCLRVCALLQFTFCSAGF